MPAKTEKDKEDAAEAQAQAQAQAQAPEKSTHFRVATTIGPFSPGALVAAGELHEIIPVPPMTGDAAALRMREARIGKLIEIGTLAPEKAPAESAPAEAPDPEEVREANERALQEARRESAGLSREPEKSSRGK